MARDVLDKIVRDKRGRECGRVDSIIVEVRSGGPAVATHIESGLFAVCARVNHRFASIVRWLAARLFSMPLGSVTLPLDEFIHESHFIEFPIDGEADPKVMRTEKWLRKHVVERIPGGKAAKV
jgi:hypothetical protein